MFSRRPVRYAEKVERRKKRNKILSYIVIFIILCVFIRIFILQTWQVHDDLMRPALRKADIVLVMPYILLGSKTPVGIAGSPQKNSIVLVSDGAEDIIPYRRKAEDAILRFITFQRFSPISKEFGKDFNVPSVMRVRGIVQKKDGLQSKTFYALATDVQHNADRTLSVREVSAARIKGRVVFRIWPLARIGLIK
ncbi:hypothetical protein SPIRO4BDMA_51072 [uncultured spirochete]|jgi:hypothetical protein|uniref:Peptidase S26 domain-containing protein n=1 Tax=uncultured spirochete TaxID=156406 RepID=A0A3P3XTE5_9SPIR|nr:hypothetical protein SPIRO4BDMA_51072 [uncultured spirochete]